MVDYATTEELADYLHIDGDMEDSVLSLALSAACSTIERWCGRSFGDDDEAIPDAVKLATLIQAARFFKRRDAPVGIAGSPDFNGGAIQTFRTLPDPDVIILLDAFKVRWVIV